MELNPIVTREVLSRWRGFRSFGLLFTYSALLAGIMGLIYASGGESERAAVRGHNLFVALTVTQLWGWMLLAPALTATSIAGERERGLLEAVQLSRLSAVRIAAGKLQSALLLIGLMLLVPLPVLAICFFTGGVSPGEFMEALALDTVTAITCAMIGLACSAWSRRPNAAILLAFMVVAFWGISSAILYPIATVGKSGSFVSLAKDHWFWSWWDLSKTSWLWNVLEVYGLTNPIYIVTELMPGIPSASGMSAPLAWTGVDIPVWIVNVGLQGLMILGLFWLTARALHKPFPEQYWVEVGSRQKPKPQRPLTASASPSAANLAIATAPTPDAALDSPRKARWEVPLIKLLHFSNPVLQREIRSKLRMRKWSCFMIGLAVLIAPWLIYLYCVAFYYSAFDSWDHEGQWWVYAFILLFFVTAIAVLQGAGAFTREQEKGTREPLLLSLLSPDEIVNGKLLAIMLTCFAWTLFLLPLMLPNIRHLHFDRHLHYSDLSRAGVSWPRAGATFLLITATMWCYIAWGLLISWLCRRTAAATIWTIGSLFCLNVFMPLFLEMMVPRHYLGVNSDLSEYLFYCWHPYYVMAKLAENSSRLNLWLPALVSPFLLFLAGFLSLTILKYLMRFSPREKDQNRHQPWTMEL